MTATIIRKILTALLPELAEPRLLTFHGNLLVIEKNIRNLACFPGYETIYLNPLNAWLEFFLQSSKRNVCG